MISFCLSEKENTKMFLKILAGLSFTQRGWQWAISIKFQRFSLERSIQTGN